MFAAAALYARSVFSSWTTQLTLYAVAATMGLIGLLYFVSSGHALLARRYSPETAGLVIGGAFVLFALIVVVIAKTRASRTSTSTKSIASVALASSAGKLVLRNRQTLSHVAQRLATPAVAGVGAGLLVLGKLLNKPTVEQRGRDLAEEPLSLKESFGALASAAQRATRQAATEVGEKWEEVEPELRARVSEVQKGLPDLWQQVPSLNNLLAPPRRGFWPWSQRDSGAVRVLHSLQNPQTVATMATLLTVGALAVWLSRSDRV